MKTLNEILNLDNLLVSEGTIYGGSGEIYKAGKRFASVVWSNGGGWEHVSIAPFKHSYTPTWKDMCVVKDMFFYENEVVVQYHPAKSEYVNMLPNCLHLWRPIQEKLPTPPSIMVGVKPGESLSDVKKAIDKICAGEAPTMNK